MGVVRGLGGRVRPRSINSRKGRNKGDWKDGPEEEVDSESVLKSPNVLD